MTIGSWASPFALQLGGEAYDRGEEIFRLLRENFGDAWAQTATEGNVAINVAEDIAAARVLLIADRYVERWRYQSDPTTMDQEFVQRWEKILGITPSSALTWNDRRRTLKARLSSKLDGFATIAADAFSPWETHIHYTPNADAVKWWPGGTSTVDLFWYSTVAHIAVEYVVPVTATREEIDARRAACFEALDAYAPAWVTFDFSETQSYGTNSGTFGFFLDQPNLNVAVFGS
jgi:hypothetical protein